MTRRGCLDIDQQLQIATVPLHLFQRSQSTTVFVVFAVLTALVHGSLFTVIDAFCCFSAPKRHRRVPT